MNRRSYSTSNNQELIDVLDDEGIRTGEILSRQEIHELGKVHRAVHLYLFDRSNNILLQRRSYNVDHYPGALSISLSRSLIMVELSLKLAHHLYDNHTLAQYMKLILSIFS